MTTRVYVDVMGDLFHMGHTRFFRAAREFGDELVVGICGDLTGESYKRRPIMTLDERVEVIAACRWVDEVIADPPAPVTDEFLERHQIHVVVHGDDFCDDEARRWYAAPIRRGIYRTVPYTLGVSTSDILERVVTRAGWDGATGVTALVPSD